jgi:ankyrin repeat protein
MNVYSKYSIVLSVLVTPLCWGAAVVPQHIVDSMRLFQAIEKNDADALVQLLDVEHLDINAREAKGRTPLFVAISKGYTLLVDILIARGAGLEVTDTREWTPLMQAAMLGNEGLVAKLLDAKADVNARNEMGFTPLMVLCNKTLAMIVPSHKAVVKQLLVAKADLTVGPNPPTQDCLAISLAASEGLGDVVDLLIEAGADADVALQRAIRIGSVSAAQLLREHGATIEGERRVVRKNGQQKPCCVS